MRTVFKYYKSYIPLIVGILAFLFGQAMCELALPGYMSDIINNGIVKGDMDYIWKIGMINDPGILRECGMLYRQQLFIGEDGGRFGSQDPRRRCSTKSRIFQLRNCRSFRQHP